MCNFDTNVKYVYSIMNWDYEIVLKKKSKIMKSIGIFPRKKFLKMQGPVIILALLVEKHGAVR